MHKLIFIVGLQKSGTSLLFRLLQESGLGVNPFKSEGDEFWGNRPQHAPSEYPVGTVYQRTGGEVGHLIDVSDATEEVRRVLLERLKATGCKDGEVITNKNPYNSVRIPWLRALFPDAFIIAMIRRPEPNVFSLSKKYIRHEGRGNPPVDGWWGVKPPGWKALVQSDKISQCAHQWIEVNTILQEAREFLDLQIAYHDLCFQPRFWLRRIAKEALGYSPDDPSAVPETLACQDDEYKFGSSLMSKNRYYRKRGDFLIPDDRSREIQPLEQEQIDRVAIVCGSLTTELAPILETP